MASVLWMVLFFVFFIHSFSIKKSKQGHTSDLQPMHVLSSPDFKVLCNVVYCCYFTGNVVLYFSDAFFNS